MLKKLASALITPILFSYKTGHFKSAINQKAISNTGSAIPWLTYPAIDFLQRRDFSNSDILEFGGGQSTVYWSHVANSVTCFEENHTWSKYIDLNTGENTSVILTKGHKDEQVDFINSTLKNINRTFDVIIIDGLHRAPLFETAVKMLNRHGMIICDNAEGYGFHDQWCRFNLLRVDFYGFAPGVHRQHLTTLHCYPECEFLTPNQPVFTS